MKQFLAIYLGSPMADGTRPSDEVVAKGMAAWGKWMMDHADRVVVEGGPLGKTKRASKAGIEDTRNHMTGFVIVKAESHDEAAKMFENHPHFAIFPGESVEIMESLPIPGR